MNFNSALFLQENFRTPAELCSFAQHYGVEKLNVETVSKWFARKSLPAPWGYVLLGLLELDRGEPVSISKYLVGDLG